MVILMQIKYKHQDQDKAQMPLSRGTKQNERKQASTLMLNERFDKCVQKLLKRTKWKK